MPGADSDPDTNQAPAHEDGSDTHHTMVKNLVRLALSSETPRVPIRRADISAKVLGPNTRQFRAVFDDAQLRLRHTFGMELVELPKKEGNTLAQRRAASQKSQAASSSGAGGSTGSGAWVLRSTLPEAFRGPDILAPPSAPTSTVEAQYAGLYSFVVALITLNAGTMPEAKLDLCLRRAHADRDTPLGAREKLLTRMVREGYIVTGRETETGESNVVYGLGPRGKVEVGEAGVAGMVKAVYGGTSEDLEAKLERSFQPGRPAQAGRALEKTTAGATKKTRGPPKGSRQGKNTQRNESASSEEEDDSDE